MSQYLPTGNFQWVNRAKGLDGDMCINVDGGRKCPNAENWTNEILRLKEDDPIGYLFCVDLEYPHTLHSNPAHDNFPLAPESLEIKKQMLSNHQQTLGDELGVKYNAKKLCMTLMDKKEYVVHGR